MMETIEPDATGLYPINDYDGDGISNDKETFTNRFVADYPRIVTRITAPITMEIEVSTTSNEEDHIESLKEEDLRDTITNAMEDKQYTSLNNKTTPYVTKESFENSASEANSYGYENAEATSQGYSQSNSRNNAKKVAWGGSVSILGNGGGSNGSVETSNGSSNSYSNNSSNSHSMKENSSVEQSFKEATMAEKTVFEDVEYVDNLDRNGVEFTNETVQKMAMNYRNNRKKILSSTVGPNAGVVTAGLYIKNESINMPVKISNITLTLSFRTPSGECLPVQTFRLRNEDWSILETDIGGGQELGPYTIRIPGLNTQKVQYALANGYIPQLHVVNYDLDKVRDSNYNPGVDNLKMVEETAKGRTAIIKISGNSIREYYRVSAFDVYESGSETVITPGISLKKAIFNIMRDQIGDGEEFNSDRNGNPVTVPDSGLKWKSGAADNLNYTFSSNKVGNFWRNFETYVKSYTDEFNQVHYIEVIKRIGSLTKYNPFNIIDNPTYDPNVLLTDEEFNKMKYWIILHNGKYFEGDINDPIWAGERYEIICIDIRDFNDHFSYQTFYFSPIQSNEPVYFDTRWNNLNNNVTPERVFPRAQYLGKIVPSDVINLEIDLLESRFLFNDKFEENYETYNYSEAQEVLVRNGEAVQNIWSSNYFDYTLSDGEEEEDGIPGDFNHYAEGGANTIKVTITNSLHAHGYEISFPGSPLNKVYISKTELANKNGTIIISRNTPAMENDMVGFIQGGIEYKVNVSAVGKSYGWPVNTQSMSNTIPSDSVVVVEEISNNHPGPFTFKALSVTNELIVNISSGNDTEYYIVRYKGPFNEYGHNSPEKYVVAYAGVNRIPVPKPNGVSIDAGVYLVDVVPANKNNVPPDANVDLVQQYLNISYNSIITLPASQYVNIDYDKYIAQKEYVAARVDRLYDLTLFNHLEVNFNDGSGWYRLILTNNEEYDGRKIDCRYSSHIAYNQQKFVISFKPPQGSEDAFGNSYNVFRGGNNEVEMFIRTVNNEEFRDRFWLKPYAKFSDLYTYEVTDSYISTAFNKPFNNFIDYWVYSEDIPFNNDATEMENTIAVSDAFVDKNFDNYFFSPLEYHSYKLRASISNVLDISFESCPDPVYTATSGDQSINVEILNMSAEHSGFYRIYWKEYVTGTDSTDTENPVTTVVDPENLDLNNVSWNRANVADSTFVIPDLSGNTDYAVVIQAFTDFRESKPVVQMPVMTYDSTPPVAPEDVFVHYDRINNLIVLNNIVVDNQYRYKVIYKVADEADDPENWRIHYNEYNKYFETEVSEPLYDIKIPIAHPWKSHDVRVMAVTGNKVDGAAWEKRVKIDQAYPAFDAGEDGNSIVVSDFYAGGEAMYTVDLKNNVTDVTYTDINIDQINFLSNTLTLGNSEGVAKQTIVPVSYTVTLTPKEYSYFNGTYDDISHNVTIQAMDFDAGVISPTYGWAEHRMYPRWSKVSYKKCSKKGIRRKKKCKWRSYSIEDGHTHYAYPKMTFHSLPDITSVSIYKVIGTAYWGAMEGGNYKEDSAQSFEFDTPWQSVRRKTILFKDIFPANKYYNAAYKDSSEYEFFVRIDPKNFVGYEDKDGNKFQDYPNFSIKYWVLYSVDGNTSNFTQSQLIEADFGGNPF